MERSVRNPFVGVEGYNCFGCSPDNSHGLKMTFVRDDDRVVCRWEPRSWFQGYVQVLHGGIQTTLMDETASWFIMTVIGTAGVTAGLSVRFLRPVRVDEGRVSLEASLQERSDKRAVVQVELFDSSGELCSVGECEYALYPPKVAARRLHYPGQAAFEQK
ncbi:PaaI family thioesterase [Salinispira pacifica]